MGRTRVTFAVTVLSVLLLIGCEPPIKGPTAIKVENGPAFSMRGQGNLARFTIYAPVPGTKIANPFDPSSVLWEIEARPKGLLEGVSIEGLRLAYAKIPGGYTQTVPENSQAAPHLALHGSYSLYRQCDDGAIAEGYSESVARILVDHWTTLPQLERVAANDIEFRAFVMKHVDATLSTDDLAKIRKNAQAHCPKGLRAICNDLANHANSALREIASP
jgi:hypothetical protein